MRSQVTLVEQAILYSPSELDQRTRTEIYGYLQSMVDRGVIGSEIGISVGDSRNIPFLHRADRSTSKAIDNLINPDAERHTIIGPLDVKFVGAFSEEMERMIKRYDRFGLKYTLF